jgi:hypothetical protein
MIGEPIGTDDCGTLFPFSQELIRNRDFPRLDWAKQLFDVARRKTNRLVERVI